MHARKGLTLAAAAAAVSQLLPVSSHASWSRPSTVGRASPSASAQ
jgi:hypothetical protein